MERNISYAGYTREDNSDGAASKMAETGFRLLNHMCVCVCVRKYVLVRVCRYFMSIIKMVN